MNTYNKKGIFKNISWLFFDKILRIGVGLFVGIWVARYLGPQEYGKWNFGIAFIALFTALSNLGLESILIRELIRGQFEEGVLMGTSFWLKLAGGIITITAALMVSLLNGYSVELLLIIFITAAQTMVQAIDVVDYYFQSLTKARFTVYARGIAFFISSLLKVTFILCKFSLMAFVLLTFAELVLAGVFLVLFYRKNVTYHIKWVFSRSVARFLLTQSWPLALSGVVIMIYMRLDQFMLGVMVGDKQVGIYSAAVRISEAFFFIPSVIASSFFPLLIKLVGEEDVKSGDRFNMIIAVQGFILILTALGICFSVYIFSDRVILKLFGKDYLESAAAIRLLIWTALPVFWGTVWSSWLISINKQKVAMYCQCIPMILNVALNIFLIPKYGIIGASLATLISYFLGQFVSLLVFRPKESFSILLHSLYPFKYISLFRKGK